MRDSSVSTADMIRGAVESLDSSPRWPEVGTQLLESTAFFKVTDAWLECGLERAMLMVPEIVEKILLFRSMGDGLATEARDWQQRKDDWGTDRQRAASMLREVTQLLDMGQHQSTALDAAIAKINAAVEVVEDETNAPFWARHCLIRPESIGHRGRASDPASARNGIIVREIRRLLPAEMRDEYAVIAELAMIAGAEVSRQAVRGILKKGRT